MSTSQRNENCFFPKLRNLALGVEKDVENLKSASTRRRSPDDDQGSAILLLKQLQADVLKLKGNIKTTQTQIQDDGGFKKTLPVMQRLLEVTAQKAQQTENYLTQYGYVPPAVSKHELESAAVAVMGSPEADTGLHQVAAQPKHTADINVPHTPKQTETPADDDDSGTPKTPKLEDYGLSWDSLRQITTWKVSDVPGIGHTGSNAAVFKKPEAPPTIHISSSETPSVRLGSKWSSAPETDVPHNFSHSGLMVTPGLFNGKTIQTVTPLSMSQVAGLRGTAVGSSPITGPVTTMTYSEQRTVDISQQRRATGPIHMMGLDTQDSDAVGSDSGSNPPTINANTIKADPTSMLYEGRGIIPDQATPIQSVRNIQKEEEDEFRSPVPPVLIDMPELTEKLHAKYTYPVKKETCPSSESSPAYPDLLKTSVMKSNSDSFDNSPVYPEFLKKSGFGGKVEGGESSSDNSPAMPSFLKAGIGAQAGGSSSDTSPAMPSFLLKAKGQDSLDNSPVMPNMLSVEDGEAPVKPRLQAQVMPEDEEMPKMPQLHKLSSPMINILKARATGQVCSQKSAPGGSLDFLKTPVNPRVHPDKENLEPHFIPPTPTTEISFFRVFEILDEISESEYMVQPGYARNQFSLVEINKLVAKINRLLNAKMEDGKSAEIYEEELTQDLGLRRKVFLLLMIKMQRLKMVRSANGEAYVPYTL